MNDIKIGDTIPVADEHREHVQSLVDEGKAAIDAYLMAAKMLQISKRRLFDFLDEVYPELCEFHLEVKHDNLDIMVMRGR
jgi:hypothetical protein